MEKIKINSRFEIDKHEIDKMYEEYNKCSVAVKYISSLGIDEETIKNNITKIYDYVCDVNYCKNCPGLKNCKKETPTICTKIVYVSGCVERKLVFCKEYLKRIRFEQQFLVKDFPNEWLDKTLRDIDKAEGRINAIDKYSKYIKDVSSSWIYLHGAANTGRTFLASVLCVDAARKNKGPIVFLNTQRRIGELHELSKTDKNRFQEKLNEIITAPILVLDDFGNEFKNDFIRDCIIFPILNTRSNNKLFTIVTSDFDVDDIVELYSTSKAASIRAKQIGNILRQNIQEETTLGDLPIY